MQEVTQLEIPGAPVSGRDFTTKQEEDLLTSLLTSHMLPN